MSSVSTAFKVHYNQKLGDPIGHLGGDAPWPLGGIDAPDSNYSEKARQPTYSVEVS